MRLELIRVGLLVELANHYTTKLSYTSEIIYIYIYIYVCVCVCVCVCVYHCYFTSVLTSCHNHIDICLNVFFEVSLSLSLSVYIYIYIQVIHWATHHVNFSYVTHKYPTLFIGFHAKI